jgi:three-Cys-motif partner protein
MEGLVDIPESYRGREQALIKHTLLESYLERLFMIVGQHEKKICYVDCFAGPWQECNPKLKDTSIAISLDIMRKCRDGLRQLGKDVQFRALYIEKEEKAFDKLRAFLNEQAKLGIETHALKGDFVDQRNEILSWCGARDFTFFFVDPTGWKQAVEIPTLLPLLQRPYSEFLINFMYDFLLRTHTQELFADDIKDIFGEVPDTQGLAPKEREVFLLKKYRAQLKNAQPSVGDKPRSAYVAVLDSVKDRTKYHLVYLTRHPLGIKVFMEESAKVDIVQKTVRAHTKQEKRIEKSGQTEIFLDSVAMVKDDDRVELIAVKEYWLTKLSSTPRYFGIIDLADMLEETDWFIDDIQSAFGELAAEGKVRNLDCKGKRRTSFVHFDENKGKGERLEKIIS